jgi:hypothetical protein
MVASDDQWSRQVFIDHRDARFADRDPNDGGEWTRRELPFWSLTRIRASQFVVGFAPDPPGRIWSLFLLVQLSGHCTVISGHRRRELDRGAWSWVDPGKASEIRSEGLEQIVVEVPRCLLPGGKAVEQLVRQVPVGGTSVAASILPVATELFEQGMGHTEANCLALLEAPWADR